MLMHSESPQCLLLSVYINRVAELWGMESKGSIQLYKLIKHGHIHTTGYLLCYYRGAISQMTSLILIFNATCCALESKLCWHTA